MNIEMEPVWKKYPDIPWGSLGWRMGYGEKYWIQWTSWFRDLSDDNKEDFRNRWPEEKGWEGFYEFIINRTTPPHVKERQDKIKSSAILPTENESKISDYYRILWLIREYMRKVGMDPADEGESYAELYKDPNGVYWRLSASINGGLEIIRQRSNA